MLFRSVKRFAALAAMFAITLQALWPLLSHARPKDPSLLVPVCTVDGITHYLEIKAGRTTPLDERSASHGEHCKLCVFGDGKGIALVAPVVPPLLFGICSNQITATAKSSSHRAALLPAQPRAPPQFS
jgi:hypothetical protein